jgi:hypothetical protein
MAVKAMHAAPTVNLAPSSTTGGFTTTFQAGGSPVDIAASDALISSPGSPTLAGMTVTINAPPDGASEILAADTSNTSITSSPPGNVLMLTGVADTATYQTVLERITYKDTASSPTSGSRTISVVVNDGTAGSAAATATVKIGVSLAAAADAALSQTNNWLAS